MDLLTAEHFAGVGSAGSRKGLSLAAVTAVIGVSAGTLVLAALPAAAAGCQAPAFSSCGAVTYQTKVVKSVRVNGRCLIGSSGKYSSVVIDSQEMPSVPSAAILIATR